MSGVALTDVHAAIRTLSEAELEELRRRKRLYPSYQKRVAESRKPRTQLRLNAGQIKALRNQLGMTQRQFAERLWVDVRTVQRWEKSQSVPPNKYFKVLRKWAGLDEERRGSL